MTPSGSQATIDAFGSPGAPPASGLATGSALALDTRARPSAASGTTVETALPFEPLWPFAIGALALVVAIVTIAPWPVGVFQDDAIYVALAKALASGEGYRMINMPGAPHATHYPPGYPLFLAALWRISPSFPDNVVLFKFANAALLSATAIASYWFARARLGLGAVAAAVSSLIGTISIVVLLVTGVVLSEPLFMALLLPTLAVCERAVETGRARHAVVAGLLIGALSLVRTVGVFVLPALLLLMVVRRQWRSVIVAVVAAGVFLVPWQLWVSAYQGEIPHPLVGKYGAYGPWLVEGYREGGWPFAWAVLVKNADELFGFLGYITLPVDSRWPRLASLLVVVLLMGAGVRATWRRIPVTVWFLALYMAVVLVWPFEPMRFVLVLWPVLAALFVVGARAALRWRPASPLAHAARLAAAAGVAIVVTGYASYNLRGYRERWWGSIQRDISTQAKPLAEWVARWTKPDDVLVTDHDLIVYLYTGRRAVPTATFTARARVQPLTTAEDAAMLRSILATYTPRFFIAGSKQAIEAGQVLATEPKRGLRYVGRIPTAIIYEPVRE